VSPADSAPKSTPAAASARRFLFILFLHKTRATGPPPGDGSSLLA
jgi:hypothetical protein